MNRRENLKLLLTGSLGTGLIWTACTPELKQNDLSPKISGGTIGGRVQEELELDEKLLSEKFFTDYELQKITLLVDIILPADEVSGSANQANVPNFIEFMMKDQPVNQTLIRGGLMWLDHQANERNEKTFLEITEDQRLEIIDDIAWPDKASEGFEFGIKFFNLLRNLTLSGFYTTELGFKDIGYIGNTPNIWEGVPQEVMDQYGLVLEEKYVDVYLKTSDRESLASWDENGNLIR